MFAGDEDIVYAEEFEEMRCIGRGNFGAAFLVKLKNTPEGIEDQYFIAKKIILNQLTQKEQEGAHLEVSKPTCSNNTAFCRLNFYEN